MTFIEPLRLLLLTVVGVLAIAYVVLQFRRRAYAVRFTNVDLLDSVAPRRPGWRRHVPALLFLIALALTVVGFARPARATDVARERATVILAIDTSLSMQAGDVIPTRIDGAKEAAQVFLDSIPERLNVGLVSFHGVATVRVPPTIDREAVSVAIGQLDLGEATAIGEAIFAGLEAIEAQLPDETGTRPPARIVLMSDGFTTVGRADADAIAAAQAAGVSVSTIAFGTDDGFIEIPEEGIIPVPVDREALQIIADGTSGQFFTAATTSELEAVYTDIGSSIGFETEQQEIILWFVGPAMVLLLLSATMSLFWFSRLP
ncbi:MAG: VWA domain-containing protein [Acidimicrobiia bacterium]|nr:VWA domain-containing protein [Acidimicrobiia bacterium]